MLECTVACSMYLAMPVTKAFLSSKFVSKLACGENREMGIETHTAGCLLTWYSLTWDVLAKTRISRAPGAYEEIVNYLRGCTSRSEGVSYTHTHILTCFGITHGHPAGNMCGNMAVKTDKSL